MIRKTLAVLFCIVIAQVGLAAASLADTPAAQRGYSVTYGPCCSGDQLDGLHADIYADFTEDTPDTLCIIFSVLADNGALTHQIETGIVKCGSDTSIDGTCSVGTTSEELVKFDEVGDGVNDAYYCYEHGLYHSGGAAFEVKRESASSSTYSAWISGTEYEGTPSIPTTSTVVTGWGELADSQDCPVSGFNADGSFSNVDRFSWASDTWIDVSPAHYQYDPAPCWDRSAYTDNSFGMTTH